MLKIYNATKTLEEYNLDLCYTDNKLEADLVIVGGKLINLNEFPHLKGIFKTGVGTDNLPFEQARERNIYIQLPSEETKSIIYDETASFTCFLIFRSMYDKLGDFMTWEKNNRFALSNKKLLILGKGKIGQRVIDRMKNFMQVLTYDPLFNNEDELIPLIKIADCISIHIPLNLETNNLFDAKLLSYMKNDSTLINTSRGQIVNEASLYNELKSNRIKAAFDVFWEEPYNGTLLTLSKKQFFFTPHVASTCKEFLEGLSSDFLLFYKQLDSRINE